MSTSPTPTPHTPLETLLLFRAVAHYGLDEQNLARIAEALQSNKLIRNAATYDARRLNPGALRDLFLRLVREELRAESDNTPGPDGSLSPASKRRRLDAPPPLTLKDARQHVDKIEAAHAKLHDAYVQHVVHEVRQCERAYESLLGEIRELEKSAREPDSEPKPQSPNGVQAAAGRHKAGPPNGAGSSPAASPRPPPLPTPHAAPHHPLRNLQPLLPQPAQQQQQQQDARSGAPPQQASEKPGPAPRSPAPPYPEVVRSPQPSQQEPTRAPAARPVVTPKPLNGTPPVLQAPQGVTSFPPPSPAPPAAEGLQHPDGVAGGRQTPGFPPPSPQVPAQGQLKWEPPYQPNAPPRPMASPTLQQQPPSTPSQPHPMPPQRAPPQAPAQPSPGPLPGQPARPLQSVSVPPHSTSQFAPPLQSPTLRSPSVDTATGHRQQPLLPTPVSGAPQPQASYHPHYQGYPISTRGQAPPAQHIPAAQAPPAPALPGVGQNAGIPTTSAASAPPAPAAASVPRPSPGLAAPQPRPHVPGLQAPQHTQQPAPQTAPPPVRAEAGQRYSSPYQPPRPAAVDRVHPRLPATATPTPAARFSPAPGPRTPMTLPPRIAGGSGTKWVSTSTPSTPRPGIELRMGYDDVPSPAYEPTSPVLRPSAPAAKDPQRREEPAETPRQKPGRPRGAQRAQAASGLQPPAAQQSKQASQAAAESSPAKVKDEAATPQPTTETGDTTADESVTGRPRPPRATKRKRDDVTPTPAQTPRASQLREAFPEGFSPADGPRLVLWTRSFNKVCGSAMEQIIHHRSANMFAAPIRDRDAPGYHKVVKQPQDLKSIRAAISHGNRAAAAAAAALPDGGDPGTSSVWLPRTEDLVPPRSIINSSQLDRELAHMFSNAIMYNPDPHHGPGPAFLRDVEADGDAADDAGGGGTGLHTSHGHAAHHPQDSGVLGYKVDEFGVVNDARSMFVEVEKLLSELRSAEVRRNVPPSAVAAASAAAAAAAAAAAEAAEAASAEASGAGTAGSGDAAGADAAGGGAQSGGGGDGTKEGEGQADEEEEGGNEEGEGEGEGAGGPAKRRRVTRG